MALSFFILQLSWSPARAQDDPEYRMEVGGGLGLVSYEGDFNSNLTKGMQPMAALVAKYRYNPRMALGMSIGYGKLKGSSADVSTWYPGTAAAPYSFDNQLIDVTMRYEYNFWAYGTGREYYGARHVAPFIAIGFPHWTCAGLLPHPVNLSIGHLLQRCKTLEQPLPYG